VKYTLINKQGKIRQFYVLAVAELYLQLEGGVLVDSRVIDTPAEMVV
jgi:hypothetical protein